MTAGGAPPVDQPRLPLGSRFWALWSSTTASGLGDGLNAVALPLLAATLTRRPILIAAVVFAQRLPWLVVGLLAGAYGDRVDRAQLMRRMDMLRAGLLVAVTALVLTKNMDIVGIYAFALVMGVCEPFFEAASQAALPSVVDDSLLNRANGLVFVGNSVTEQTVGPALGGLAFSAARAVPFAVDGVSFVGSALCLFGLGRKPDQPAAGTSRGMRSLLRDTKEGLVWYRQSHRLVVITATVSVLAFSQAMVSAIMVLFALERLGLDSFGYGIFMGAIAIGNIVGGLIAARVLRRSHTGMVLLGAIALSAAGYLAASTTRSPYLAATLLAFEAVAVVVGNVATISYRQLVTPDALQARVAAVWRTAIWGAIPLGALVGGVVASAINLQSTLVVAAILQLVAGVLALRPLRHRF